MIHLRKGDRVKLAVSLNHKRPVNMRGTIHGTPRMGVACVAVRWDGYASGEYVHRKFIEKVDDGHREAL